MSQITEKSALDYLDPSRRHPIDEQPKPAWAKGPDGNYTPIGDDIRFDALWQAWADDACRHEQRAIVRWVNAGSQTIHNWFCRECGTKLSSAIKSYAAEAHGVDAVGTDTLASRSNAYRRQREEHLQRIVTAAGERAQGENRAEYDDYLRSPEWNRRAAKVMERAQRKCEGCLSRPPDDVHHLTYAHIRNEFAFELVALCRPCHERWHGRDAA